MSRSALDRLAGFISVKRENLTKHITFRIQGKNQLKFEYLPPIFWKKFGNIAPSPHQLLEEIYAPGGKHEADLTPTLTDVRPCERCS